DVAPAVELLVELGLADRDRWGNLGARVGRRIGVRGGRPSDQEDKPTHARKHRRRGDVSPSFQEDFQPRVETVLHSLNQKENAMPGMGELIVILLIVLVVFGANKLPGIGDALGRSIKNFKKASAVDDDEPKGKKQIATKPAKQIEPASEDEEGDDEWEEVVVR